VLLRLGLARRLERLPLLVLDLLALELLLLELVLLLLGGLVGLARLLVLLLAALVGLLALGLGLLARRPVQGVDDVVGEASDALGDEDTACETSGAGSVR